MPHKKLSVLMAAAECTPFVKVGGLADVLGSLPQAVSQLGCAVSVILPLYGSIKRRRFGITRVNARINVKRDGKTEAIQVFAARFGTGTVRYLFLKHPMFDAASIYRHARRKQLGKTSAYTRSAPDVLRFSWFSEAVVEAAQQLKLNPDIIHCHDWHTALIPTFVDTFAVTHQYPFTKTILTIHNLANQGVTGRDLVARFSLPADATPSLFEDYYDLDDERLNSMKLGILSADAVTTVSRSYAKEILTPEYGAGLERFLARRKKDLTGILNGIDTQYFNPSTDRFIQRQYGADTVQNAKALNKQALRRELKLPRSNQPLFGMVSRLVPQKGLDILMQSLEMIVPTGSQVVILGTGEPALERALRLLARKHNGALRVITKFDASLAQKIYAGADVFLMPSQFEPCGLGQMIAMRYGTVPLVRLTGGLRDTVRHLKTGVAFTTYSAAALTRSLRLCIKLYSDKKKWYTMIHSGMKQDFSWRASAAHYVRLYKTLL